MTLHTVNTAPSRTPEVTRAQRRAPRVPNLKGVAQRAAIVSALLATACDAIDLHALNGIKDGQPRDMGADQMIQDADTDSLVDARLREAFVGDAVVLNDGMLTDGAVTPDLSTIDALTDGLVADAAIIIPDVQMSADLGSDAAIDALAPDAAIVSPDAAIVSPDAAVVEPDAAILEPDAAVVVTPDAAIISPDAFVYLDMGVEDAEVDAVVDAVIDAAIADAFVPYVPCTVGFGPCRADGLVQENGECSATPGVPGIETCNNVDDDCDGHVDNNINPRNCATACGDGVFVCEAGGRERCTAIVPVAENVAPRCNGEDDNCDGSVDEGLSCDDGQPCQNGIGECRRNGVIAGGVCAAVAGNPTPDVCDGLDQNCDGVIDNGVTVLANGQRLTGSSVDCSTACGAGIRLCRAGPDGIIGLGACNAPQPSAEICDGVDNDCDGIIDNGTVCAEIGSECRVGIGSCAIVGHLEIDQIDPNSTYCETDGRTPQEPTAELCDGVDNNCDGRVDESFPESADACSVGLGACENSGTTTCVDGILDCNVAPHDPQLEVCNLIDDDCDGRVDENDICANPCSVGDGICRVNGILNPDGSCNFQGKIALEPKVNDICNGLDDDCDGRIDENDANNNPICAAGLICSNGLGDCRKHAILEDVDGQLVCPAIPFLPRDEVRDGQAHDEDCDGEANER